MFPFRQYHLFRVDAKVVTGGEAEANLHPSSPASGIATPSEGTAVDSSTLGPQAPAAGTSVALASAAPPALMSAATPPVAMLPEISVAAATGLPTAATLAPAGADSPVTLRLSARLVDVPLVALDKKGRPITNLKPEDLQIFDNGAKVDLRSFVQAGVDATQQAAPSAAASQPEAPHAYSNRTLGPVKTAGGDQQGNTVVLYLDNTLSFADLTIVRDQMRTFLNGLTEGEHVALYVMLKGSFQILQESTADHALVEATLAKWTPSAASVSSGQEQEARNRQTMDYVRNLGDLALVNGNQELDTAGNLYTVDPNLRPLGDNPGRDVFSNFVELATHLGAVPGHKSLVWIASDNVLADWTNNSFNVEKGDRIIQGSVLRAQEAMNDAHVSVYPLDASHLESGGIDASIGTKNVALNPVASANQIAGCGSVSTALHGGSGPPELTAGTAGDINTCQM